MTLTLKQRAYEIARVLHVLVLQIPLNPAQMEQITTHIEQGMEGAIYEASRPTAAELLATPGEPFEVTKIKKRMTKLLSTVERLEALVSERNNQLQAVHDHAQAVLNESLFLKGFIDPKVLEAALQKKREEVKAQQAQARNQPQRH